MTIENDERPVGTQSARKPKSIWVAYLLWLFLGVFAAHRFYLRRHAWLQLFTVLLFGIGILWVLADLFLIPGMVRESKQGVSATGVSSGGGRIFLKVVAIVFAAVIGLGVVSYLMAPESFDQQLATYSASEPENPSQSSGDSRTPEMQGRDGQGSDAPLSSPSDVRRYASLGETIEGRRISTAILSVSTTFRAGGEYIGESAQPGALFVIVEYEYTNISDGPIGSFNKPDIRLIAPSGTEYKSDSGATGLEAADREMNENAFSDLNPMITYRSVELFEVAETLLHQPGWLVKVELDRGEFFVRVDE